MSGIPCVATIQSLVYGPKSITDPNILAAVTNAIQNGEEFTFTNQSMGGDPQLGVPKTATIQYQLYYPNLPFHWRTDQERTVRENATIDFGWSLIIVIYGAGTLGQATYTTNYGIYKAIYDYHQDKSSFVVGTEFFGGDPAYGYTKTASLLIWNHGQIQNVSAQDGSTISFADD